VLVLFGALSNRQLYERSLNININLWWGLAMLIFGILMLLLGRRGSRHAAAAAPVEPPVRAPNPH
jgi:hypothetical protein